MKETKFCVDCIHCQDTGRIRFGKQVYECLKSEEDSVDFVTGRITKYYFLCSAVRLAGPCGEEGKLFEPKI